MLKKISNQISFLSVGGVFITGVFFAFVTLYLMYQNTSSSVKKRSSTQLSEKSSNINRFLMIDLRHELQMILDQSSLQWDGDIILNNQKEKTLFFQNSSIQIQKLIIEAVKRSKSISFLCLSDLKGECIKKYPDYDLTDQTSDWIKSLRQSEGYQISKISSWSTGPTSFFISLPFYSQNQHLGFLLAQVYFSQIDMIIQNGIDQTSDQKLFLVQNTGELISKKNSPGSESTFKVDLNGQYSFLTLRHHQDKKNNDGYHYYNYNNDQVIGFHQNINALKSYLILENSKKIAYGQLRKLSYFYMIFGSILLIIFYILAGKISKPINFLLNDFSKLQMKDKMAILNKKSIYPFLNIEIKNFIQDVTRKEIEKSKQDENRPVLNQGNNTIASEYISGDSLESNKWIMRSIETGIIIIGPNKSILPDYSEATEKIFNQDSLSGIDAIKLLTSQSNLDSDQISRMSKTFNHCLGESKANFLINKHIFPSEIVRDVNGETKYLKLKWVPINSGKSKNVTQIAVFIRDISETKSLKEKSRNHHQALQRILQIIRAPDVQLSIFFFKVLSFLKKLSNPESIETGDLKKFFGEIHTIESDALGLDLGEVLTTTELLKSSLEKFTKSKDSQNAEKVRQRVQELKNIIEEHQIYFKKIYRNQLTQSQKFSQFSKELQDIVSQFSSDLENQGDEFYNRISQFAKHLSLQPIKSFINSYQYILSDHALKNKVPESMVHYRGEEINIYQNFRNILGTILTHCFRNSAVHGIEPSEIRNEKNKPKEGQIFIDLKVNSERYEVIYSDDGAGLNLDHLRQKFPEIPFNDTQKLAEKIFDPEYSTHSGSAIYSGKGKGLFAVKNLVESNGGFVSVSLTGQADSRDFQRFQLKFSFPGSVNLPASDSG